MLVIAVEVNKRTYYYRGYVLQNMGNLSISSEFAEEKEFATQFATAAHTTPIVRGLQLSLDVQSVWIEESE